MFSCRSLWGIAGLLNMPRLCELCPSQQTSRTWREVDLQLNLSCVLWILVKVDTCFGPQGGWHARHGTHASGEFPPRMSDHSHPGSWRHWAHFAQSHQELLCGRPCSQTSLSRETKEKKRELNKERGWCYEPNTLCWWSNGGDWRDGAPRRVLSTAALRTSYWHLKLCI